MSALGHKQTSDHLSRHVHELSGSLKLDHIDAGQRYLVND